MKKIYLDYNATTPIDPRVLDAMLPYLKDNFGNPSSIHSYGSKAKAAIDEAREFVAGLLGVKNSEIAFTSGGSESNNWAIKGVVDSLKREGNHIITTAVEHASCLEVFKDLESKGFRLTYLPVNSKGMIDLDELRASITDDTVLISCIYVNNETGFINPIYEIGDIARGTGTLFHTDAVQAVGKVPVNLGDLPVDLASISSHKIYGPKGAGALYIKKGSRLSSFIHGGGQERGRRSGTENVSAIYGFGKACEIMDGELQKELQLIGELRKIALDGIMAAAPEAYINGDILNCVANSINVGFEAVEGDSLVMNLDLEGIAVSTGSACSEGNVDPSHVLLAMGLDEKQAISSLRITLGRFTTLEEINAFLEILPKVLKRITAINQF